MQPPSSWLSNWRDIAGGLESSFTAAALVIGALWTYLLFVRRRLRLPRAAVTHQLVDLHAGRATVLHVSVRITNIGEVLIRMTSVMMRVQQLVPIPAHIGDTLEAGADPVAPGEVEIGWPVVAERTCTWRGGHELEIEPGETEECHFDVVIPAEVTAVEVYTHISNPSKYRKDFGWNTTTVHRLRDPT